MKKPVVVVSNKPLTQVDHGEAEISGEKKTEKKQKKKNKGNNSVEVSTPETVHTNPLKQADDSKPVQQKQEKINVPKDEPKPKAPFKDTLKKKKETTPQNSSKPFEKPKPFAKKTSVEKFKPKHKDPLKKVAHKTIDKKNNIPNKNKYQKGLTDERLKAFGINPKKFIKKQKYGQQNQQKNVVKKETAQSKQNNKMKNKLKKALQG